jgi:rSAM-associated Gly-rich repeat protein
MSTQNRISKALTALLPGGALGASILLALTSPSVTAAKSSQAADPSPPANVSERLLAIRSAVSRMESSSQSSGSAELEPGDSERAQPAWWGNGGFGRWGFGWRNGGIGWHNWGNGGWHNGGWGNAGWGNGGWGNGGWHNYWHNF